MIYKRTTIMVLCLLFQGLLALPASAEIRQVDGNLWLNSSVNERQAYLIGVANIVQVHQALKRKRGEAVDDAPINRILAAMDANSIQSVEKKITSWYETHHDKRGTPVLGLIWKQFVEVSGKK
ncbi:MAG: hypothetical protein JNM75_03415 [Rhodospirillales bacterium]|nr:hypothetical protein [Rhodospirillales bacterium]